MTRPLLVGSLAYDRIMDFPGRFEDHFLPDKLHQISVGFLMERITQELGGTAGNIAYSLSLLGISPHLISTLGNDSERYIAHLKAHGIETDTLQTSDDLPTAGAYVMTDGGNNQITAFAPGAMNVPYTKEIPLKDYPLVCISPTSADDMDRFAKEAKSAGVPYFFDPGQQTSGLPVPVLQGGIEGAAALFVNDYELALVSERTGWSEADIRERVGVLVVTLGEQGSRILTPEEEILVPAVAATPQDPTGAGDAYRAGFIAGHLQSLPIATCAQIGSVFGAYAVEAYGTQTHAPSLADLAARYEATYGEPWPL